MVRMKLEMKRAVRNKFYVIFTLINLLNVLLGYILLVTIDKVQNVTFQDMFESVYTVYTQFGTLLFSAFIIMQFYVDYKEKNIFFYKTLGFSELRYYLTKVGMILLATIIGSAFSSILVCTICKIRNVASGIPKNRRGNDLLYPYHIDNRIYI